MCGTDPVSCQVNRVCVYNTIIEGSSSRDFHMTSIILPSPLVVRNGPIYLVCRRARFLRCPFLHAEGDCARRPPGRTNAPNSLVRVNLKVIAMLRGCFENFRCRVCTRCSTATCVSYLPDIHFMRLCSRERKSWERWSGGGKGEKEIQGV